MFSAFLISIYCILIIAASICGGLLPTWIKLTHIRLQLVMSFVGGLILGVAVLHMMPHALAHDDNLDRLSIAMLLGVLAMFFLMRVFNIHQHDQATLPADHDHDHDHDQDDDHDDEDESGKTKGDLQSSQHGETQHKHEHQGRHGHCHHDHGSPGAAAISLNTNWLGVALGFAIHTLIDGVALASSVIMSANEHDHWQLYGFGIFLAILLHKPLDAMSIAWTIESSGWSRTWLVMTNVAFSLMCPLGALGFFLFFRNESGQASELVALCLAFAAGVFVCISLSDILPEVSFHSHDRFKLSMALILGVALAYGISFVEPKHRHANQRFDYDQQWQQFEEE